MDNINPMPIDQIAAALAAAQAEMTNPPLDSANPHFRSRFSSLAAVRNAVVPVLARHGISMTQDLRTDGNCIACTTILSHSSGQQMTFGPLVMPASKADAQGFGSAATYARRYALMAAAGVVGDEDDDANAACSPKAAARAAPPAEPDGYSTWRADMVAVAGEGSDALKAVWAKSDPRFRQHATLADSDWWTSTKALAANVAA